MKGLCIFFVITIISSQALGFRLKRQATDTGDDLEDRYGWQLQFPSQNEFPGAFPGLPVFPGGQPQRPPQRPTQRTTTTTAAPAAQSTTASNTAVTTESPEFRACIASCPVTAEYNPVCGSNGIDYDNPSRLECAKGCGANVNLLRTSRCPPPTPAS